MVCKCPPNSPFLWYKNLRPSALGAPEPAPVDVKKREEDVLAYRVFGVYSRAKASVKPTLNKHEI